MGVWAAWVRGHRILTSMALGGSLLFLMHPTLFSLLWGLPIVILGVAMRIWSSGHIRKDASVAMDGPYAWTRNPLYLGNFLLGLGMVLMGRNPLALILYLIVFYLVYAPTIQAEEDKLRQKFGAVYQNYTLQTPRFFPALTRSPPPSRTAFDWGRVMGHREYRTWLGVLGILLLLVLRAAFGS
jgi:protein-S-isoprenylcysteine O-methyltransferase Ste14